ncbi:ubiquitin conjugating enzyme [Catenaria anguillulae PL171]|uniref:Ubiquitin conjugating enzyme n=1 Tax=Catenaria anguillulae PL171 TaxID=765915 RepID=A0A1Y2HX22_9FUNG|nr:ubiquitin conjugating enzyme [Catenaria anguillulae PL171]
MSASKRSGCTFNSFCSLYPGLLCLGIQRELAEIQSSPPHGISAQPNGDNLYEWTASILGPEGSPYEGGVFFVFDPAYPFKPPRITFKTRVYHPNVNSQGGICIDLLKDNWSPALTISKVLLSISSLLTDPNPSTALFPCRLRHHYMDDRERYERTAREWTKKYAS